MTARDIGLRAIISAALLGVIVGLLLSAGCCGQLAAPSGPAPLAGRSVAEQAANAVLVTLECSTAEVRLFGRGSGTIIAPGTVLTAMHVASCSVGELSLGVIRADGTSAAAHVIWRDPVHDLALLAAAGIVPIGTVVHAFTAVDQTVCAESAHPHRDRRCGKVTDRKPVAAPNGVLDIRATIDAVPGNSGAGLYDALGRLVGVVTNRTPCAADLSRWCGSLAVSQRGWLPW